MAENEDIEVVEADSGKKSLFANKKLLLIIAIVVLVLVVGAATFFLLGSSDDEATTEDAETTEVEGDSEAESEQALDIPEGDLPDVLPEEEQTDETVELALPDVPNDTPQEQPQSAQSRLEQISGGIRNPSSGSTDDVAATGSDSQQDLPPIELPEGMEMPEYPGGDAQQTINPEVIAIINEFVTAEKLAEEIFKLRRRAELHNKETTRIYQQLGDLEDKLREKDRIIRAQDTAYTKGPKVSPASRNNGPIKPPEPSWDISPTHTGP